MKSIIKMRKASSTKVPVRTSTRRTSSDLNVFTIIQFSIFNGNIAYLYPQITRIFTDKDNKKEIKGAFAVWFFRNLR